MVSFRRSCMGLVIACGIALLGVTGSAQASTYTDTKNRFSLELPKGWKMHPVPGDMRGMMFRRDKGSAFALLKVSTKKRDARDTLKSSAARYLRDYENEIGYHFKAEIPTTVGAIEALQESFLVYARGDKKTVRSIDVYVIHAFSHVHYIHVESLDQTRKKFLRDINQILPSYKCLAGESVYGPLIARWSSQDEGRDLYLSETGTFVMSADEYGAGRLEGTFVADAARLRMHLTDGYETYRYVVQGRKLILSSPNLDGPKIYLRSGRQQYGLNVKQVDPKELTRDQLIGKWRVVDVPGTEPLYLILSPTGSVSFGPLSGAWRYRRGLLTIDATMGGEVTYHVSKTPDGETLYVGGGDLAKELRLQRE